VFPALFFLLCHGIWSHDGILKALSAKIVSQWSNPMSFAALQPATYHNGNDAREGGGRDETPMLPANTRAARANNGRWLLLSPGLWGSKTHGRSLAE
jgi:hypothetical protein